MQLQFFVWWFPIAAHRNIILIKCYPALHKNGWKRNEVAQLKSQKDCDCALAASLSSPHTLRTKSSLAEQCQSQRVFNELKRDKQQVQHYADLNCNAYYRDIFMVVRSRWRSHSMQSLSPYHSIPESPGKLRMAFLARMEAVRWKVGDIWIPILQIKA